MLAVPQKADVSVLEEPESAYLAADHLNVWIFRRKQRRILRQWPARFPPLKKVNPSPKSDQFRGETECLPTRFAEPEDELERARR